MTEILHNLSGCLADQLASWPEAKARFDALDGVRLRTVSSSGLAVQFNPSRIASTTANIKADAVQRRSCFLCAEQRRQEQISYDLGDGYELLVNPFPILKEHFTVTQREHRPQVIRDCCRKMVEIASELPSDYIIFYNGPRSGASAPDHLHMQIGTSAGIPLIDKLRANNPPEDELFTIKPFGFPVTVMRHTTPESFLAYLDTLTVLDGEYEPRLNIVCLNIEGEVFTLFIPRGKHRPDCYYATDDSHRLVSPGTIDMLGLIIVPCEEDFLRLTEKEITDILVECSPRQPEIKVGIMSGNSLQFCLNSPYSDGAEVLEGEQEAGIQDGKVLWHGKLYDSVLLQPAEGRGTFTLHGVTIGIDFHWERKEEQTFSSSLMLIPDGDRVWAVNRLPVEEYLTSVISSEMNPAAPKEFLKAHAVISRSWVLAQIENSRLQRQGVIKADAPAPEADAAEKRHIRWYDHDQHSLFDVCADDHCQRYQGLTRIDNPAAVQAVHETAAETLVYDGHLCDARFSKCCGGASELFETCWQDDHKPYLVPVRDCTENMKKLPDLTLEEEAEKWIHSTPLSFCSNPDSTLLARILNSYDRETKNFYRWQVSYKAEELTELFRRKSGIDVGLITDLKPVKRGPSGRLQELEICGTEGSVIIGKELEIRRVLSESHLYSSAFTVEKTNDGFTLHGAGWGHGVGLCQTGAAVMGENGYTYREILEHYYPGTGIGKFY